MPPLGSLPALLRGEPAVVEGVDASSVLAVPEPARAFVVAGLARLHHRHPVVVAVPTTTDAERLAHDVRAFLGADQVELRQPAPAVWRAALA
jgi:hypothetical protein